MPNWGRILRRSLQRNREAQFDVEGDDVGVSIPEEEAPQRLTSTNLGLREYEAIVRRAEEQITSYQQHAAASAMFATLPDMPNFTGGFLRPRTLGTQRLAGIPAKKLKGCSPMCYPMCAKCLKNVRKLDIL